MKQDIFYNNRMAKMCWAILLFFHCFAPSVFAQYTGTVPVTLNIPSTATAVVWYKDGVALSGQTATTYAASSVGSYYATYTDGTTSCTTDRSLTFVLANAGTNVTLTGATNNGTGTNYQWFNGTTTVASATTSNYTANAGGKYHLEYNNGSCVVKSADYYVFLFACNAGTTAPTLSGTTVTNFCSSTTANLNGLLTGTAPSGTRVRWHTVATNPTAADSVATPSVVATAGTYYAYYYDPTNMCYSPASAAVTFTKTSCVGQTIKTCGDATYSYTPSTYNTNYSLATHGGSCLPVGYTAASMWGTQSNIVNPASVFWITLAQPVTSFDFFMGSFDASNLEYVTLLGVNAGIGDINQVNPQSGCTLNKVGNKLNITGVTDGVAGIIRVSSTLPFTAIRLEVINVAAGKFTPISCMPTPSLNCATLVAPTLSATSLNNVCPATTVNLNSLVTSTIPSGTRLRWHTVATNPTVADSVATPSVLATAGTYYGYYFDAVNGCYSPASVAVTVTINPAPAAPTATVSQPTCAVATGTITVTAPTSGVTYSFDNGTTFQAAAMSNALVAGTYQIIVKANTTNCVSTATATTINAQPASPIISNVVKGDPSVSSCPALNDGTITITATGSNLEYSKDNGATWQASNSFTSLTAASYTIKVRNSVTTCEVAYVSNPIVLTSPVCSTCATPSVGGTATYTGGAVCSTNNMGTITLSGNTGDVVKWQTSTNNGTTWTDIAATANKNSYIFINAANGQQYRAVVNSGSGCVDAYSSVVTIATSATACTTTTCSYNSGSFSPAVTIPTTASLTTHIVLVNPTTGAIDYVTSANSAAFTGVAQGDYLLYAITYDNTILPTPTLTVGTNISTLTGCLAVSDQLITKVCINNPPVITSAATVTTPENVSTTTPVYTATATDPNSGQTLTFSLETGGADNGKFTIDPTTGEVKFIASPDFEAPTDANGDNIYEIIVKSCDNGSPQYCATKTVQITVTDVIECAGFAAPTTTVAQPTCAVATGTITVTAPANNVTYSFDNGATFQATATSSALAAGTYQVKVKDNTTNCVSTATATIINAQPAIPTISNVAKTDASLSSCPALNDGTISVTANGSNLQYSINNGATWQVSNTFAGLVAGSYTVKIKDNTSTCEVAYASNPVVLTAPICNLAPTITSAGTATTPENVSPTTPVYTVTSTDPNVGQTPIYSFETGGADNGKFNIDPTTGVVTFITSPDFETPTDADGNNIYEIKVKVCDNGTPPYCATKTVSITVTDVAECPIASVGGTTNYTGGTLCNTTNSGIITLTGKTGNVVKWQTSINAGTSWTDIANTTTTLTFTNAANNQQYRAVVNNSGACTDANSTAKTITTSVCSTACDAPIPVITGH